MSEARGTGGFDLGYTKPGFREDAPNTGIFPQGGTLAGLSYRAGVFGWFQNQDTWTNEFAGGPALLDADINDKATRYTHCLVDDESGTLRVTEDRPAEFGGPATIEIPGNIPDGPVRVVFHDANYDPPKDALYESNEITWHWDNIQIDAETSFEAPDPPPSLKAPAERAAPTERAAPAAPPAPVTPVVGLDSDGGKAGRYTAVALLGLVLLVAAFVAAFMLGRATAGKPAGPSNDAGVADPSQE